MASLMSLSSWIIIIIILIYQFTISPIIRSKCRFKPTCSRYGIEALRRFGIIKGLWLIIKRLLKCQPLHPGGEDFVPSVLSDTNRDYLSMDSQYNFFIIVFMLIFFMIWQMWEQDKNLQHQQRINQITNDSSFLGKTNNSEYLKSIQSLDINLKEERKIKVRTDVLELTINTCGGDIESALLLTYPKKLDSNEPFQLLETTPEFIYQAQSGLTDYSGPDNPRYHNNRPFYKVNKDLFLIGDKQNELIVPMTYKDINGNTFTKVFSLRRGEYVVNVDYIIYNNSTKPLKLSVFGQLRQTVVLPSYHTTNGSNSSFTLQTFRGAAYSTLEKKYTKYKFDSIVSNENLNIFSRSGWIAMLQRYFVAAWIPRNNANNNFYTMNFNDGSVVIGYKSQPILVYPRQTIRLQSDLWIGPKIQDKMANVAPYLDLTVDYGWLWFISQPMFKLLKFIHGFLNNWGFSIIAITLIIRFITYPLTKAQYTSMARIRMLQPKIQAISERYKDNKQLLSQEIMTLYKTEKVNPLGGCLPLIIQMPIFLALYYMLMSSVELRHAPFIFWVRDLSEQDSYYALPILMGLTMYFIQKISPSTMADSNNQKIMNFMPVFFTVFFLWFPSGLVLYYIVSNLVTIFQQQLIYHSLEKQGLHSHKREI